MRMRVVKRAYRYRSSPDPQQTGLLNWMCAACGVRHDRT